MINTCPLRCLISLRHGLLWKTFERTFWMNKLFEMDRVLVHLHVKNSTYVWRKVKWFKIYKVIIVHQSGHLFHFCFNTCNSFLCLGSLEFIDIVTSIVRFWTSRGLLYMNFFFFEMKHLLASNCSKMVKEEKERRYNLKERVFMKEVVPKFFPWELVEFYELTT